MLRVIGLVVTIALADSLNPSTITPALYLASGDRPRRRILEFALAVFVVQLAAGSLIALGPGRLLLSLLPALGATARHWIETGLGVAMLIAAALLWRHRSALAKKDLPHPHSQKSSLLLGATIIVVELPTAFPYFAAIAAIVSSGAAFGGQVMLLALFNLCFVLPLLAILAAVLILGEPAQKALRTGREFLQRHWPVIAAVVLLFGGLLVILLAATGFVASGHGRVSHRVRQLRRSLHP